MKKIIYLLIFFQASILTAQSEDPILFTVADNDVHLSEFKYIYEKNNADKADYSQQSINEYLDLYKKFKLKVHRARMQGLDTVKTLQSELAGYRKQLAATYLKDKEIAERLVNEVEDRYIEDREVSHIFIAAGEKDSDEKKERAWDKIVNIHNKLVQNDGAGFGLMAKSLSEDPASAKNNGYLGFYTSPLPDGFYEFENAMYTTGVGEFSKPFRSRMGYHILHVTQARDARGEMEIAHILIRKRKDGMALAETKAKIDSIYAKLDAGENFEEIATQFSQDLKTKDKGGYLGFFGINQYELPFEDAAFRLHNDNQYSRPVETKLGYHIIKRISKRDYGNKTRARKRIETRINNNNRFKIAEEKLLNDVKEEAGFIEERMQLRRFVQSVGDNFYSYKWEPHNFDSKKMTLFTLAGKEHTLNDFGYYVKTNIRERLKFSKNTSISEATDVLYDKYVKEIVMSYEEANLESKYPDFKSLMREYREGILLFEITKNEVWDKASQDTVGLRNFYEANKLKYNWPNRLKIDKITVTGKDDKAVQSAYKYAKKKGYKKFKEKYDNDANYKVYYNQETVEDASEEAAKFKSKQAGSISELQSANNGGNFSFLTEVLPARMKSLAEARGYVIADYQDQLEKKWVDELKSSYPVMVNQETLNSIIR